MILNSLKELREKLNSSNKRTVRDVMEEQVIGDIHIIRENLSLSKSELSKILNVSRPTLDTVIEKLQANGKLDDVIRKSNGYLFNHTHCNVIADYLNVERWVDTVGSKHVIMVSNLKGGTGKSTVTVNLASSLSMGIIESKRVLVIDLDPQGSCRNHAQPDMEKSRDMLTAVDLMLAEFETDGRFNDYHDYVDEYGHTAIVKMSCQPTQYDNLDILPAFPTDTRFNRFVYNYNFDGGQTAQQLLRTKVIDHLIDDYDVILIDCPPSLEALVENALEASTGLIIPVTPRKLDWSATTLFFDQIPDIIDTLPSKGENLQWYKVLLNNVEHEHNRDAKMVAKIQNVMDASNMFIKSIERSSAFEVAAQQFRTVIDMRPKEKLAIPSQLSNAKACVNSVTRELVSILKQHEGR